VVDDNENPDYNEDLTFEMAPGINTAKLMIFDSNLVSDTEYGHIDLDLSAAMASGAVEDKDGSKMLDSDNKEV